MQSIKIVHMKALATEVRMGARMGLSDAKTWAEQKYAAVCLGQTYEMTKDGGAAVRIDGEMHRLMAP
jgi:hypothetical protein